MSGRALGPLQPVGDLLGNMPARTPFVDYLRPCPGPQVESAFVIPTPWHRNTALGRLGEVGLRTS